MQVAIKTAINAPLIDKSVASAIAREYVVTQIDSTFEVVDGVCSYSKLHDQQVWSFIICCAYGPLYPIYLDLQTKQVIAFTDNEIQTIREKAFILKARSDGLLPVDEYDHIIREYARLQADNYLAMDVGLQAVATDGVFVPLQCPIWQFLIEVRLPKSGVIGVFGMIDVDAKQVKLSH